MLINWSKNNDTYYGIVPENYDLIKAIQKQVSKTLEIANSKEGWNCVIFDIWIYNECRIICSIQDKTESIGSGQDFNVTIQVNKFSRHLNKISADEYAHEVSKIKNQIIDTIKIAFQNEAFLMSFDDLWLKNPFVIRFSIEGILQKFELQFG